MNSEMASIDYNSQYTGLLKETFNGVKFRTSVLGYNPESLKPYMKTQMAKVARLKYEALSNGVELKPSKMNSSLEAKISKLSQQKAFAF